MSTIAMSRVARIFAVVTLTMTSLETSIAGEKAVNELAQELRNRANLEAKLRQPCRCRFVQCDLSDCVDYFQGEYGLPLFLDYTSFEDREFPFEEAVEVDVEDVTVGSALNLVLEQLGLGFVVDDEVIKIAARREAKQHRETRVYELAGFNDFGCDLSELAKILCQDVDATSVLVGTRVAISQSQKAHRRTQLVLFELRSQ